MASAKTICCYCFGSSCMLFSLLMLLAGAGITSLFAWQFREQLKVLMPLANGSMSYQGWERVPTDLLFEIWVWNVTNPKEITENGTRPKLQQVGPFAFRESRFKTDIEFFDNDTVAFREYQLFHYDVSRSIGRLEDIIITSVSMPYAVTAFKMQPLPKSIRRIAHKLFLLYSKEGLFTTRTANEILLGYEDGALKRLAPIVKRYAPKMKFQSKTGLFIGTNNTDKGLFVVHTGKGDLSKFNRIVSWNGKRKIDVWPEDWANVIDGTDGSMFPPDVKPDRRLKIFTTDICRSLEMEYKGEGSVLGIPSLKYGPVPDLMLNATLKPENKAFCIPHCLDSGVMNITKCQHDVPLAISAPHFTDADTYAAAIDGVQPGDQYRTTIEVEPNTGFVINAGRKMQMNLILQRMEGFEDLKNLPDLTLLPLMWLNESGGIEGEAAKQFKAHLLAPIQIVNALQWVLLACGAALLFVTIGSIFSYCCANPTRDRKFESRGTRKQDKDKDFGKKQWRGSVFADEEMLEKLRHEELKETDII